ncbi:HalOD1 output domain-containing protein [Natronococcus pandeyae]|uniref:HalOD1 output domain-containing protein n=1 Tax=Natronococcus pandeyae TaxID=2055836 RepID=UPI0011E876E0|nr:HalOD1 output domain-containing protein [Natronococcus pandeyae]
MTDAVIDAIEEYRGERLQRTDFVLFEDIDSESLNTLFRHDSQPRTTVTITTDDVRIELWGDGGVKIRVTDQTEKKKGNGL